MHYNETVASSLIWRAAQFTRHHAGGEPHERHSDAGPSYLSEWSLCVRQLCQPLPLTAEGPPLQGTARRGKQTHPITSGYGLLTGEECRSAIEEG